MDKPLFGYYRDTEEMQSAAVMSLLTILSSFYFMTHQEKLTQRESGEFYQFTGVIPKEVGDTVTDLISNIFQNMSESYNTIAAALYAADGTLLPEKLPESLQSLDPKLVARIVKAFIGDVFITGLIAIGKNSNKIVDQLLPRLITSVSHLSGIDATRPAKKKKRCRLV